MAAHRLTVTEARQIAVRAQLLDRGFFALPILHHDRLVGKLDATADRKAGRLVVHAIHEDVRFTRAIARDVRAEIVDLAAWLGLTVG